MIDLYYWTTPNGHKVTIFLEETGIDYKIIPIDITKGEQFNPEFLKVAPNNRIPAMVDHNPKNSRSPISIFESGAMLLYLGEKTGEFLPSTDKASERAKVLEWLFWQMAGLGPMAGQNHHFGTYAKEKIPYAIDRYVNETARLYKVLNKQLETNEYVAGDYSIADMAIYPWIVPHERQKQNLGDFPALKKWFEKMAARPAVVKAYAKAKEFNTTPTTMTDEVRKILFGQK